MRRLVLSALLLLTLFGCSVNQPKAGIEIEKRMEIANNYYDRGKYNKAADHYLEVVFERSSNYTPTAQFRLAECYFKTAKYADSILEYQELIRLFPDYKDNNIAYFRIGEAYYLLSRGAQYSQEESHSAIDAFEVFLDRYPTDAWRDKAFEYIQKAQYKQIEKKFNNGYIYYRLYDYSAALMYFDEITELGNQNEFDRKALFYKAKIFSKRNDAEKLREVLELLKNRYPENKDTKQAEILYKRKL